jgi:lysophospholipase L1-like esterase
MRLNLATLEMQAFAPSYGYQGSGFLKSQIAITDDGRFVAIGSAVANNLKVYDLKDCTATKTAQQRCPSFDYRNFVGNQVGSIKYLDHIRFINEGLLSLDISATDTSKSGRYLLSPTSQISSLTDYIGLGDSYTSGEGAFDYIAGTDTTTNRCHQSSVAYPALLTRDLFSANGGHSVACSGAVINDIGSTDARYRGQIASGPSYQELQTDHLPLLKSVETNFMPGYIAQHRFIQKNQPRVVTVSVGGNDIGFGKILEACVAPKLTLARTGNTCFNTYEDRLELESLINKMNKKWKILFEQLALETPLGKVFVVGYPDVVSETGKCAQNVHLNDEERLFTREVVAKLNSVISKTASEAGVQFVDISQALVGHRLCEAKDYNTAMNGLTAGKDAGLFGIGVLGGESYHPNSLGHQLIEQEILRVSKNLTLGFSYAQKHPETFLNKPKSGRPVKNKIPANMTAKTVISDSRLSLRFDGMALGLAPNTSYKVGLAGESQLGTISTNGEGWVDVTLDSLQPKYAGSYILEVEGMDQNDNPITFTQPIYVATNPDDYDGDGDDNTVDGCPLAANLGVDEDNDRVDDTCDNIISTPLSLDSPKIDPPESTPLTGGSVVDEAIIAREEEAPKTTLELKDGSMLKIQNPGTILSLQNTQQTQNQEGTNSIQRTGVLGSASVSPNSAGRTHTLSTQTNSTVPVHKKL